MKKANHSTQQIIALIFLASTICLQAATNESPYDTVKKASSVFNSKPLRPRGDFAVEQTEAQELAAIYDAMRNAYAAIEPGTDAGLRKRAVKFAWTKELEHFLENHPNSAWSADVSLQIANACSLRSSYSKALQYYSSAWDTAKSAPDAASREMAGEAASGLARLLALTGHTSAFESLLAEVRQFQIIPQGAGWRWGREIDSFYRKHPSDSYKCGLHSLDQLGRLTHPQQFDSRTIVETESSTNGFTLQELVQIGATAGLAVQAVRLEDFSKLPVPSIVHLSAEHFIVVRQKQGDFYEVMDPIAFGHRWLTLEEISDDATGALLVSSEAGIPVGTTSLDSATASSFRGRCHGPNPDDHEDPGGCEENEEGKCCPPGAGGGGSSGGTGRGTGKPPKPGMPGGSGPGSSGPGACCEEEGSSSTNSNSSCSACGARVQGGMPFLSVSEAFLNYWVIDKPLTYTPAYGPTLDFRIAYNYRRVEGNISFLLNQGAMVGQFFTCSWLSWAELDASGNSAEVMMPGGGWARFDFPGAGNTSSMNYFLNIWAEKLFSGMTLTGLRVWHANGAYKDYTQLQDMGDYQVYFMTSNSDPTGKSTTFQYDDNNYLTNVVAADSVSFEVKHDNGSYPYLITSITNTTMGTGVRLDYGEMAYYFSPIALTSVTDAANIVSHFEYDPFDYYLITVLHTPYGNTTVQNTDAGSQGIFDRFIRITHPDSSQEFYALLNDYQGGDWSGFVSSQIPTNTPLQSVLDTTARDERNTFYWNAYQFDPIKATDINSFTWSEFKRARIRHWLASTDPTYTHFNTLSWEQAPSADGTTESGAILWYNYDGKTNAYERGTQILPAVKARVMPDGSTWYKYYQRNSLGIITNTIEKWCDGATTYYRTNRYVTAANGIDITQHISPDGTTNRFVFDVSHPHLHVAFTNAIGETTSYTYDANHRLVTTTIPSGLISSNTYGGDGFLSRTVDYVSGSPLRTNSFAWLNGNIRTNTDERGLTRVFTFDGLNRLTRVDYPDSSYNEYRYTNGVGDKILDLGAERDRLGNWTYTEYTSKRQVLRTINARGVTNYFEYCLCGGAITVTRDKGGALEQSTAFEYDRVGNLLRTISPGSITNSFSYDFLNRRTISTDSLGSSTNAYDNLSRLIVVASAFGNAQELFYDNEDRLIGSVDPNGVITASITYDGLGRVRSREMYGGGTNAFGYTANISGPTSYTNELGNVVQYAYHAAGWKTNEVYVGMATNKFTYNQAGDVRELRDGKDQLTSWGYDEYGRSKSKTNHSNVEIFRYKYDANSRLTNRWSKAKLDAFYAYDQVGNLTNVDYNASTDIRYKYDALNRLTNMVDAVGTTSWYHDTANRFSVEDGPWTNDNVTNRWNTTGLRTNLAILQPSSYFNNNYFYDPAHRLTNVTSTASVFSYYYDTGRNGLTAPSKLITRISLPNTSFITNVWDDLGRLTGTYLKQSGGTITNSHAYLYNNGNQRTKQTRTDGGYVDYLYDSVGQLYSARTYNSGGTEITAEKFGYKYDPAWNLNQRTNNAAVTTVLNNELNQVTNFASSTLTYDDNGNLTNFSPVLTYAYDDENQLIFAQKSGWWKVEFIYDGKMRLRKKSEYTGGSGGYTLTSETRYIYDGMLVVQERDSSNVPTVTYTRGTDLSGTLQGAGGIGGLLARSSGYSGGSWFSHAYYHADGNGNITFLINSSQSIAASYKYDPFGGTVSSIGSLASANVYRFSSKEIHSNSGAYYYGRRFYDPNFQRWLSRDPIGEYGGRNLYAFLRNTPLTYYDRWGKIPNRVTPLPPVQPAPDPRVQCNDEQKQWIKKALDNACEKAKAPCVQNCGVDSSVKQNLKDKCDNRDKLDVKCPDAEDSECIPPAGGPFRCAYSYPNSNTIVLCPPYENSDCGDPGCLLLHELTHTVGGSEDVAGDVEKCAGCPPRMH